MPSRSKNGLAVLALIGAASLSTLIAQVAVNTQVNTMLSQPPLSQNASGISGSVRYSTNSSVPMRSELRHAYWKAGATPSDIRYSYSQLGARTPGGPMRYVDYKPTYLESKKPSGPPPPQAPRPAGSIRYASPPPPSVNMVNNQLLNARVTPSAVRSPSVTHRVAPSPRVSSATLSPKQGTVRYARY